MSNTEKKTKKFNTRLIAGCGMLSAIAFVLQLLEFPLPMLIPDFIKFDFSDLPELIGAFAYGPVAGIVIAIVKNLLHALIATHSFGVGELCNCILGAAFAGVAGLVYKKKKTKKRAALGGVLGAASMAVISFPFNLFVVYPFYYNFMPKDVIIKAYHTILPFVNSIEVSLLVFNVPFTLVKGLICVGITMLIYQPLRPILKGKTE
ncbi:MAG: ECF transporter S component [Eubacterium sp.]|nr:ECF transporter S component [Eubacterium sp.]